MFTIYLNIGMKNRILKLYLYLLPIVVDMHFHQ